jgi:glycosyltransferase involved in cell wall biosynthesis
MRILILNYEYPPLGGGAGVATAALAQGLVEQGAIVDVLTASAGRQAERRTAVRKDDPLGCGRLSVYRVKSRRIGIHQAGMLGAASYLVHALPLVRLLLRTHSYDVVHVFFSLPTGALLPFLNLNETPVVVSLRGSDVPGYDPYNTGMQRAHRVLAPLTRWIWHRADRVIPVCESLGRLTSRTAPDLEYTVIPNGVDLRLFHPRESTRSNDAGPIRCVAVARLVERKGLGELIRAFGILPRGRFSLEIVGNGPDEGVLRALVSRLGLDREVTFLGSLARGGVAERYREADLFTLPSSAEAFGNVFAEALASGLPIVGSTTGGIPELVEHGANGLLVPPGDAAALAQAICYLGDDPDLRQKMGARNRSKAESTLQWSQVTRRYLAVYRELMHELPAGSLVPVTPVNSL